MCGRTADKLCPCNIKACVCMLSKHTHGLCFLASGQVRTENLDLLRRLKTRLVNLKSMTQAVSMGHTSKGIFAAS